MPLYRIKEFDPDYKNHFDNQDVIGFDLYSGTEKIGSVDDLLVDDEGRFRYFVINTGAWVFGKKVLLPIGRARIDYNDKRVLVDGFTRAQVEALPEFTKESAIDYDHEERVRGSYRPIATAQGADRAPAAQPYTRDNYRYDQDPALYNMNDRDHQNLRLYEERLVANKQRRKVGEVVVGKRVETQHAEVQVPVERERIVIEVNTPGATSRNVAPGEATFNQQEVARVEAYEETPEVRKEAFLREQVNVRKEVDREVVNVGDDIRREELDVDSDGNPVIERRPDQGTRRDQTPRRDQTR